MLKEGLQVSRTSSWIPYLAQIANAAICVKIYFDFPDQQGDS